ncbi:MAG: carbamoyl-phosphate synthase large subunit [Chloroflexi bacterium]|nr:carbamoyl-phosphate synthase large subunit [Chloroflexota bacterium]
MPSARNLDIKKVMVIGSGPIVIGQAAEFDYAGTQACKSLREEGVTTVLVNSNPATIMTDEGIADVVYIEPLVVDVLKRVIQRERPDGLLPTLGGQTGLNLAVELADAGILDRYGVRLLGTSLETIKKAEDRELFKQMLTDIGEPVIESTIVHAYPEALAFAKEVGLPLIIRPAYTLGGTGGGIAQTWEELEARVSAGLGASPIRQILLERCLTGWKEVEYEVMRDSADSCITVCNMENFDPMGVHTGDSIVVAPSQTLSDKEYQMLRSASLKIIRALGIEGGCNIQFGLDPKSFSYYVIEVNPRVSRSSALASKATGYPIARVAAKIAVGRTLDEIPNAVTKKTMAAFEPALDYCVVKIPRWPFDKFEMAERTIGTQMKATGEVMAIDRSFEAAFQKAVRSLELSGKWLSWEDERWNPVDGDWKQALGDYIRRPNDLRLWALMAALRRGADPQEIYEMSGVDPWFTVKLQKLVDMERRLAGESLSMDLLLEAKQLGFSDRQVAAKTGKSELEVEALRRRLGIRPVYKMVDTCAAEFEAATPYFYSTYEEENEASPIEESKAVVVGSGPIRIGQGIEFDYCSVHSAWALQEAGVKSVMINSNPETVSTDFDTSDRLYFEPLDEESVRNILDNEQVDNGQDPGNGNGEIRRDTPMIVQFGGQTAINLVAKLAPQGVSILGSTAEAIDLAEDRRRFDALLADLGIPRPPGAAVRDVRAALRVAQRIGYPVLVRPSYVLGGRAMQIVHNPEDLTHYVRAAIGLSSGPSILIDKYLEGKEVEVDAVCDGDEVLIPGIMEHIERAGVHSGDSFAVYPGVNLYHDEVEMIVDNTVRIGRALQVRGLMNVQYVIYSGVVHVLEVNPRASRTVPFLSKVTGVPMVRLATNIQLGSTLKDEGYQGGLWPRQPLVAVKAPVFSMSKLLGVDVYLGPEMKSTGEVMGIDKEFVAAFYKALLGAGMGVPQEGRMLLSISDRDKPQSLSMIERLARLGYKLFATEGTSKMIESAGIPVHKVAAKIGAGKPDIVDIIRGGTVDGVINTVSGEQKTLADGFAIRRAAVESRVPCFTSLDTARAVVNALTKMKAAYTVQPVQEYRRRGRSY